MTEPYIPIGKINGLYGVKGWVKVYSYTQPRDNILSYQPWYLYRANQWQKVNRIEGKAHGKGVIAQLEHYQEPELARQLMDVEIGIQRHQLPSLAADEYYWSDLHGLTVVTTAGKTLGEVDHLLETGAHDVLVIVDPTGATHLVPFVLPHIVLSVDLIQHQITVHWDPEF